MSSIVPDGWSTHWDRTWLASSQATKALDAKLAVIIGKHWARVGANPSDVSPFRCETTARALVELGRSSEFAMHCTILLALLGELLLCAESGGILQGNASSIFAGDEERENIAETLRLLRNAVAHPAAANAVHGEVAIGAFADYVERSFPEETWASTLRRTPGHLATRAVAFFALRLVDQLGRWQASHWGIKTSAFKVRQY